MDVAVDVDRARLGEGVRLHFPARVVEAEIERVAGAERKHVVIDVVHVREGNRRAPLDHRPVGNELFPGLLDDLALALDRRREHVFHVDVSDRLARRHGELAADRAHASARRSVPPGAAAAPARAPLSARALGGGDGAAAGALAGALARGSAGSPFDDPDSDGALPRFLSARVSSAARWRSNSAASEIAVRSPWIWVCSWRTSRRSSSTSDDSAAHAARGTAIRRAVNTAIRAFVAVGVLTGFLRFFVVR